MVQLSLSALVGGLFAISSVTRAAPAPASTLPRDLDLGIHWESDKSDLPLLKLPYATYRAATYDKSEDYYVFRNIRFAAPPVGNLRWRPPQPPAVQQGIQDGSVGYQCFQAVPQQFGIGQPIIEVLEPSSEDCLFLDVWVPGKAIRGKVKNLPVLFWIFGGGYSLGSKSFFVYDGSPLLKSAGYNMIYVAPNYRLGAFGWLNGAPVQADGVANAGLHDQRAALQWTKDYISLVGGNGAAITAMGESAGAGSIMHHLVAKGGTLDPIFTQAVMQSPAFEPMYDDGRLLQQFRTFEAAAGCKGKGMACLRSASTTALENANKKTINQCPYGTFGYGPGVDKTYIRDLPGLEMAKGNYWKNVRVMVGHTSNEGLLFTNPAVNKESEILSAVNTNFPNATATTRNLILSKLYPKPGFLGLFTEFATQFERLSTLIQDVVVTCNVRWIVKAYAGRSYSYVFSVIPGIHGFDILATFWRTSLNIGNLQLDFDIPFLSNNNLATGWQSYFTSFVRCGDPNTYRQKGAFPATRDWPLSDIKNGGVMSLNVDILAYSWVLDADCSSRCDWWQGGLWTGR
ncbi:Alpha/Beta hydrolase protein [Kalaharituber pfeilii]|nr:Alpha/Beta hydrolase protein [Kalaharituber pfeilii]